MRYYRFISFIIIALFYLPSILAQDDYLWPTNASQHLTSTFGETRSAHFHSGLDIKTWGKEGYKVFAAKDGVVYRMSVTARGYGKSIYLKHDDGIITVYAHLQILEKNLQSYVDSVRMLDYSFETDLFVESAGIKVKKGDVIGYTGSTGIGPPHLHFETRYSDDLPFNSLKTNLSVKDNLPPVISSLLIVPLSQESIISGNKYPQIIYPSDGDEVLDFGAVEANGSIGLALSTYDEANGVTNKYAVYEIILTHERDTLFYEKLDSFRFDESGTMFLDRLSSPVSNRRTYQTLYPQDGPVIPFYIKSSSQARIIPSDDIKEYFITAKDYYGNTQVAKISIKQNSSPQQSKISSTEPDHTWYWTNDWTTNGESALILRDPEFGLPWNNTERLLYTANGSIFFSRLFPDQFNKIRTPNRRLTLRFLPETFYDTLTVAVSVSEFNKSPLISIYPEQAAFVQDFEVQFNLAHYFEKGFKYALFRLDRSDGDYTYVDSEMRGRTLFAYPSSPGEFIIMPDNDPPELGTPKLIKTDYGVWQIHIPITDALSKINYKAASIAVNGVRGITEYDFEDELLIYYLPGFIPEKSNTVEVVVSDLPGNVSTQTFSVSN